MKKFIYSFAAAAAMVLAGCTQEDIFQVNQAGLPQASDIDATVSVDQNTNEVTFTLNNKGVVPIWRIHKTATNTVVTTANDYKEIFANAGTYSVEVQMYNGNGISEGTKLIEFTVNNTVVDFGKYTKLLAGDGTREWRIANDVKAHLACGESGTDGTNWWAAGENEKASVGMYDNRLSFDQEFNYTFNPGESGTIYVNKDVTRYPGFSGEEDYNVPVETQTTTYQIASEGNDLFLVLSDGAHFPYIANDDIYDNPRYKIQSLNASTLELVSDNGSIAWHYIFTSKADDTPKAFTGFKYDSDFNLWKSATVGGPFFWYAPGWAQIADPQVTIDGASYSFVLPEATTDQWQAQMHLDSDISSNSSTFYDFSVIITTSEDHPGVTVKLTDANDDGNFFMQDRIAVKAYEDYIYYFSNVQGIDASALKLFFDFGGNAAGTEVTIKNVVFKDHANDDGTVLPAEEPDEPVADVVWNEDAPANLWAGHEVSTFFWWADNNWSEVAAPSFTDDNGVYTIVANADAGGNQWQGQVHLTPVPAVSTSAASNYDFKVEIESDADIPGVTIKLVMDGNDDVFYTTDRHDVIAYENNVFKFVDMPGLDMDGVKLVFDFAGCPAGNTIKVHNIVLQEHDGAAAPAGPSWVDEQSSDNLWWGCAYTPTFWWADDSWSQVADPTFTEDNGAYTIYANAAAGYSQWQGQVHLATNVSTSAAVNYDFRVCIDSEEDIAGVTVKLVLDGDDNVFYTDARHDIAAYEDNVIELLDMPGIDMDKLKLVFDFAGCPAGNTIKVHGIILQEHR